MAGTRLSHKVWLVVVSLALGLVLLEAGLRAAGYAVVSGQVRRNKAAALRQAAHKVMCVGESTTALGGVDSYPAQLERILNEKSPGKYAVMNNGMPGATTSWIVSHIEKDLDAYRPDLVVVMMGINDVCQPAARSGISPGAANPLKSLRVYRLLELLGYHIREKASEVFIPRAYVHERLARKLSVEGKFERAEEEYRKAIALEPRNPGLKVGLAWFYYGQGKFPEAEGLFKEAIRIDPGAGWLYVDLARLYRNKGMLDLAEKSFKKALECDPRKEDAFLELAELYQGQGKPALAVEILKKGVEADPGSDLGYGALARLYESMGNAESAREYYRKEFNSMEARQGGYYCVNTADNFRYLKRILDARGIRMVCAQYPLRPIEPLEQIFDGEGGVTFVESQDVFRKAIQSGRYEDYFWDRFAGDFGHCTAKGNKLLAESIAKAILGK